MEETFYSRDELCNLLNEEAGEKVIFIGLNRTDEGDIAVDRYVYLNSNKFKAKYLYKQGSLIYIGHVPLDIQVLPTAYQSQYEVVIKG